ncbi:hypothetical protein M133_1741 [Bacteroides fragilis str. S24L26]|nr:hypothetical protein M133_1741 [Bacteroides fragilis str. S24L26]
MYLKYDEKKRAKLINRKKIRIQFIEMIIYSRTLYCGKQ